MRRLVAFILLFGLGACDPQFTQGTAQIGDKLKLQIEIAETSDALEQGLMDRIKLPADHGMLFVMPATDTVSFWMHHTLIPLDMLFFDQSGKLVEIQANRQPRDEVPQLSQYPVKYVLEINGGQAAAQRIAVGDQLNWQKTAH